MPTEAPIGHRFGPFLLIEESGELWRGETRVPITPKEFDLLVYLVRNRGRLVKKEELLDAIWPDAHVEEGSLSRGVSTLRTALGESTRSPEYIETVPRRGYRFIAEVSSGIAESQPTLAPAGRRRTIALSLAALVAILLAVITGRRYISDRQPSTPANIDAIAVLPFTNADAGTEHLSDGLTEALINNLAQLPGLRVMARTTVFRYKGKTTDPGQIGRALKVPAILTGAIQSDGSRYRISAELVNVRDGTQIWGNQYVADRSGFSAIQAQISEDVARRLRRPAAAGQRDRFASMYSRNPEAYELYLKGLHSWNKRTKDDLLESIRYFNAAIEKDPAFARAYAGLANVYGVMAGMSMIPAKDGQLKANAAAEKALEIDDSVAEAWTTLAAGKSSPLWDFEGAERDFRRAIQLNPNHATAHQWFASHLQSMGRLAEARTELDTAYRLDPLSPAINRAMCFGYYYERRFEQGIEFEKQAADLDSRFGSPPCVFFSYWGLGEYEKAIGVMKPPIFNMTSAQIESLVQSLRRSGPEGLMQRWVEILTERRKSEFVSPTWIATLHARAGNKDEALRWLELSYRERGNGLNDLNVDPSWDNIRSDPRFLDLVRRIGLPQGRSSPETLKEH